jgi:hypothetical protein
MNFKLLVYVPISGEENIRNKLVLNFSHVVGKIEDQTFMELRESMKEHNDICNVHVCGCCILSFLWV